MIDCATASTGAIRSAVYPMACAASLLMERLLWSGRLSGAAYLRAAPLNKPSVIGADCELCCVCGALFSTQSFCRMSTLQICLNDCRRPLSRRNVYKSSRGRTTKSVSAPRVASQIGAKRMRAREKRSLGLRQLIIRFGRSIFEFIESERASEREAALKRAQICIVHLDLRAPPNRK